MDAFLAPDPTALPTAQPFVGRAVVLQIDPQAAQESTLVEDLLFMRRLGVQPLVVHASDRRAAGVRLVGLINRLGGDALCLDGVSASTIILSHDDDGRVVVRSVNAQLIEVLLGRGYIPVFSSEGSSFSGTVTPIDAAEAARVLAASVHAVRLLYPSDTGGIPAGSDGIIHELTSSEALTLAQAGTLGPDDALHLAAAALSVRSGVDAAQLLDLRAAHASVVELLTAQHLGTQVISLPHVAIESASPETR